MHSTCCTSSAGGSAFTKPIPLPKEALTESTLLEYVRFQAGQSPRPAGRHHQPPRRRRRSCARKRISQRSCQFAPGFHQLYWKRSPMGVARPRQALSRLRVKAPKRVILSAVGGRGCAVLVQFPYLARSGNRRLDAASRIAVERSVVSQSGRFAAFRITDSRAWQRQQTSILCHWLPKLFSYWITICVRTARSITGSAVFVSLKGRARGSPYDAGGLAVTLPSSPRRPPVSSMPTRIGFDIHSPQT